MINPHLVLQTAANLLHLLSEIDPTRQAANKRASCLQIRGNKLEADPF